MPSPEREEFRKFVNKKIKQVNKKKKLCRIIIFGSYKPQEKEFLEQLKNDLKNDGYENTWLVEDYPNFKDLNVRTKSIDSLEFSHINLFIITGEKGGFTVELEHLVQNASTLSFKTIILYEKKLIDDSEVDSLSQLHIEGLKSAIIRLFSFDRSNYSDLIQLIRGQVYALHYHYVINEKKY
ncbi:MAG: hypothetical protein ACFFCY_03200 [Promethearchaeota archaeon]